MRKLLKWGIRGFLAIFALAAVLALFAYVILLRTVQPYSGEMVIAGLSAPVNIVRDKAGIPHIEAKTRDDALVALGFAHAQDRLWQMEILRMSGQGRLSEMFGFATKNTDVFLRTLGFFEQAKSSLNVLSAETIAGLEAYSRGVNAFINRETRLGEPALSPEFLILGHTPEPWQPAHSVTALKMMSLDLSKNLGNEIARLSFAANGLNADEIEDLFPVGPLDQPGPLPDLAKMFNLNKPQVAVAANTDMLDSLVPQTGLWASNNWVLSGNRTTSGKPLLANDPHLSFSTPSLWYLAHLSYEHEGKRRNIIGASLPATPLILLGRTDKVAWGFTNAGADVQDVFIEQLKDDDANQYKTPDGWQKFTTRQEIIRIKGEENFSFSRRSTRHGPVLPGFYRDLENMLPSNMVAALQWTGFSDRDTSMDAVLAGMNADTMEDYMTGVRSLLSPMQAMVIADVDGNIGLFAPARVPIRRADNIIAGRAPVPGWDEKYDWRGFIPIDQLPLVTNPENGAIGTANSRFVDANYKYHLTFDWAELFRFNRLQQLVVNAENKLSVQSMIDAQADIYSAAYDQLRNLLLAELAQVSVANIGPLAALKKWDARMDRQKAEPLIMNAWIYELVQAIYRDDLGSAFDRFNQPRATALIRLLEQGGARNWCDDQSTRQIEQCAEIAGRAFDKAISGLKATYGSDWQNWRWGDAHIAYGEHRPFSQVWPLEKLFTVTVPSSGGRYTLNRGTTSFTDQKNPHRAVHGASYRAIYDFADLDKSMFIQTTGQSGNPFSELYGDMAVRWANVEYLPMTTRAEDYMENALGTWVLRPAE